MSLHEERGKRCSSGVATEQCSGAEGWGEETGGGTFKLLNLFIRDKDSRSEGGVPLALHSWSMGGGKRKGIMSGERRSGSRLNWSDKGQRKGTSNWERTGTRGILSVTAPREKKKPKTHHKERGKKKNTALRQYPLAVVMKERGNSRTSGLLKGRRVHTGGSSSAWWSTQRS